MISEIFSEIGTELLEVGSFIILYVMVLFLAKVVNDLLTPYKIDSELVEKDNTAVAVSFAGYLGGVTAIFIGAYAGPDTGLLNDLMITAAYSVGGILALNFSRFINDKLILYKFSNTKELIEDKNVGTGAVQFGSQIASALIIAGAISGEGGGPLTALVFFGLGQVALILFTFVYNLITPFDIHKEIEDDNVAAGIAFGGTLIALGIVIFRGTAGDFVSWGYNLIIFGLNVAGIILFLPLVRLFFDKIIIPKKSLNSEIQKDRNIGAGFLEAAVSIGFAVILFFTLA